MKTIVLGFLLAVAGTAFAQDAVLRAGEQIEIRLGGVPPDDIAQVSGQYQVDGQGFVNLPHIGKVKAEGVTQGSLQDAIENSYRSQQIYTNPTITISVASQARFVNIGGDVRAPQRVPFTPDLTLLGAINAAGGFTEYANQKKVRLLRDGSVTLYNVIEFQKDPSKDPRLKPGDTITVEQSFW